MKGVLRGAHAEACGSAMATSATSTSTRAMLPSSRRTAFSGANVTMSAALQQGSKRVAGSRQPRLVCLAQAAATELSAAELRGERGSMSRSCNRCLRVTSGARFDLHKVAQGHETDHAPCL